MSNQGANKMAHVLQERMKCIADKPSLIDIGTIQSNMSLRTNKFPQSIPQSDYLVCRSAAQEITVDGVEQYRRIRPGDRVLVAWVGDDVCVIDLIFPATAIR